MTLNKLFARFLLSLKGVIVVIRSHMFLLGFAYVCSEARALRGMLPAGTASFIWCIEVRPIILMDLLY